MSSKNRRRTLSGMFGDYSMDISEKLNEIKRLTEEVERELKPLLNHPDCLLKQSIPKRLLGYTLGELVSNFKDLDGIERYIKMLQDLIEADERDLAIRVKRGLLPGSSQ